VSPIHGPWMALRGVVIIDVPGPSIDPYLKNPIQNPFPEGDIQLSDITDTLLIEYKDNYEEGFKVYRYLDMFICIKIC
jgi:hypothetical protein